MVVNLVKNGGFECPSPTAFGGACSGVITVANGWCLAPSGTFGLDWTVEWAETVGSSPAGSSGNIEIWRGTVVSPAAPRQGLQNMEFDSGGRPGTANANIKIHQAVSTCPGAQYTLAYSWRPRPGVPASSQTLAVRGWGNTLVTLTGFNTPWADEFTVVTGKFGPRKLEFVGGGRGINWGFFWMRFR